MSKFNHCTRKPLHKIIYYMHIVYLIYGLFLIPGANFSLVNSILVIPIHTVTITSIYVPCKHFSMFWFPLF